MPLSIALMVTGSEITEGRILDSNSQWMAEQLSELGYYVSAILAVDDDRPALVAAMQTLLGRADVLIISGGLGPTTDDLTREALAEFSKKDLQEDPVALLELEELYRKRQRKMSPSNRKQVTFPGGASVIKNPVGTAPGFYLEHAQKLIVALPGVPWELKAMFSATVLPMLQRRFAAQPQADRLSQHMLRVFGIPESVVGERVTALQLPASIAVAYRAAFPEVHVLFRGRSSDEGLLAAAIEKARTAIGTPNIFSESKERSIEQVVHELLIEKKQLLAIAESCTGGRIAAALTGFSGASQYFEGAVVAYSNRLKHSLLGVPEQTVIESGAVSEASVCAMAQGLLQHSAATIVVSVSGIAGPNGGTAEKPVGTFFVGLVQRTGNSAGVASARRYFVPLERPRVQQYATYVGMDTLRRALLGFERL